MTAIGMIGCGAMGAGMVKNLLAANYTVYVSDPMCKAQKELESLGAHFVSSTKAFAADVRAVFLSLPTPKLLVDSLSGKDGLFAHLSSDTFVFDVGTSDTDTAKNLQQEASAYGVHFLDCPVSGGPAGAQAGTLTVMVGGKKEAYEAALPYLKVIGEEIRYIGSSGAGQTVKLCNNMIVAGMISLLSETMVVAEGQGVEASTLFSVLEASSGHSRAMEVFGENLKDESFDNVLFSLAHMAKDLELYMKLSNQSTTPQPVSSIVSQLYRLALQQKKASLDSTAVYSLIANEVRR
ncbi:NAD(P)-dependent oxidoreductase [Shouchella oshimensis]|uniref:NAD(P)-dependent oxidoreductase n=1 Tax=Shouchella oshimensis TaxID=290588 RepID=UPI000995413A|nr:NAD(P)-dependent oxidoreductase [Shouchella oshimensis]RQW20362.1 NAD(P)-dependent oxidoreductase [Bacillus sp. C1-1]